MKSEVYARTVSTISSSCSVKSFMISSSSSSSSLSERSSAFAASTWSDTSGVLISISSGSAVTVKNSR